MKKWVCTVCGYLHEGEGPLEKCPVCQAPASAFNRQDETMPPDLEQSLLKAFAGESKAHVRNLAFARKAEIDDYPELAKLFAAVSEAERVHAASYLKLLEGAIGSTEENLVQAFENEIKAHANIYPALIKQANDLGREDVADLFAQARDVEDGHAALYKKAMNQLLAEEDSDRDIRYHVCQICGYISTIGAPDACPICRAGPEQFKLFG